MIPNSLWYNSPWLYSAARPIQKDWPWSLSAKGSQKKDADYTLGHHSSGRHRHCGVFCLKYPQRTSQCQHKHYQQELFLYYRQVFGQTDHLEITGKKYKEPVLSFLAG